MEKQMKKTLLTPFKKASAFALTGSVLAMNSAWGQKLTQITDMNQVEGKLSSFTWWIIGLFLTGGYGWCVFGLMKTAAAIVGGRGEFADFAKPVIGLLGMVCCTAVVAYFA